MVGVGVSTPPRLQDIVIDCTLAMGAHGITLGAGQTVDGIDVSDSMVKAAYDPNSKGVALAIKLDAQTIVATGTDNAWTDIDLSGYVGAEQKIVIVKILNNHAGDNTSCEVRTKGNVYSEPHPTTLAENAYYYAIMLTDSSGYIQYHRHNFQNTIYLVGYFD